MFTDNQPENGTAPAAIPGTAERWFAVKTRPRHEKKVVSELEHRGIVNYLPLVHETHRWSDRRKELDLPLFPGYVFVQTAMSPESRLAVVRVNGVLHFVGSRNQGTAIPEKQIEGIRKLLASDVQAMPYAFVKVGQRVSIRGGALDGLEGIVVGRNGRRRFVISIEAIERSLAISVEGYDLEAVHGRYAR